MDLFSYLVSGIGVYVALLVFTTGMAWRVWQWMRTPKSPVRLGLFPKPKSGLGRFGKLLKDTFIAPQSVEAAAPLMVAAFAFHIAALGAFVGHLRLIHEFTPLVSVFGVEGMNTFAAWSGGIAGVLMLLAILYWIGRRTYGVYKNLSTPEDFLLLGLLLGVVVLGDHLRFVGGLHAVTYQAWFASLVAFRPAFPPELAASATRWALDWHMLFVDAFLIYFPFSKLTHAIGAFTGNLVRSSD